MANCRYCHNPIKWIRVEINRGIGGLLVKQHAVEVNYKKFDEINQGELVAVRSGSRWRIEKVSFPNKIPGRAMDEYEKKYRARIGHVLHVFVCKNEGLK